MVPFLTIFSSTGGDSCRRVADVGMGYGTQSDVAIIDAGGVA